MISDYRDVTPRSATPAEAKSIREQLQRLSRELSTAAANGVIWNHFGVMEAFAELTATLSESIPEHEAD